MLEVSSKVTSALGWIKDGKTGGWWTYLLTGCLFIETESEYDGSCGRKAVFKKGVDDDEFLDELALVVAGAATPDPSAWMEMSMISGETERLTVIIARVWQVLPLGESRRINRDDVWM